MKMFKELNIPKIIHLTYKNHNIPDVWKNTIQVWKEKHPEWEVRFWTDDDNRKLIKTKYPDFLQIYDSYEYGIQRADVIRYYILYTYGGLYSDMDIAPNKNIDRIFYKLNSKDTYLIKSPHLKYITNSFMASKPKSLFWLHVVKELQEAIKNPSIFWVGKHLQVMNTTGPIMLTRAYESYKEKRKISFMPQEFIFPSKCNACTSKPCKTRVSYTKILEGSSWCSLDSRIYIHFLCNYRVYLSIFMAMILITCRCLFLFN